jgi:zinc transport system substrate-binding protein
MSNSRIIFILGLIIVIGGAFILFPKATHHGETETAKISVVTTLFPLYSIAQEIGGPYADVTLLLPPGVSPHNYEPTPSDILTIAKADVFIYTGPFMEPWAADILAGMDTSHMTILNASTHAAMAHHEEEDAHEEDNHEAGDPHIWLSPDNAHQIVRDIQSAYEDVVQKKFGLDENDLARDEEYAHNDREEEEGLNIIYSTRVHAARYHAELADVFTAYDTELAECETRTLVYGGHYAFGYIADAFNLTYIAAQGYSPDAEPSAQDLATLSDIITKENATAIFTGELESAAIADMLARETGAQVLLLNPAGNIGKDARDADITFIDILESNLATLREGLRCE